MKVGFDEKVAESLRENSQWLGSPDKMWAEIQDELNEKIPWWRKQQLWLGTAVAATILLVFLFQGVLTPLPPVPTEPEMAPQMRSLAVQFVAEEPLVVNPGDEISIVLELSLEEVDGVPLPTTLIVTELGEGSGVTFQEVTLNGEAISSRSFTVLAPQKAGPYLIAVQGTIMQDGQLYKVHGEQEILVQNREEDNDVQQNF